MTVTHCKDDAQELLPFRIGELTPAAFAHATTQVTVRETHISWVVLTGQFAYKIKKPVKFDFIDASTLERRLHYCTEELRLNRRLAPELYVDVVTITRGTNGVRVGSAAGQVIEYAVRMHQFDASSELPALLQRSQVELREITDLAEVLACFHLDAPAASFSRVHERTRAMHDAVFGNLAHLISHLQERTSLPQLGRLIDWTHDMAHALESSLQARERDGFVRECHGDLHCANIVRRSGRLVPFDCIDFDPQLRWIDVMSDLAFLIMDLASRGHGSLGTALLSRYLEITGDYEGVRLLPFYCVYRALVRAKVDAIAAEQSPARSMGMEERMRHRLLAADRWTHRPRPVLVLMHGPSGSGKSWLSERLVSATPAVRVRSDLERKRLGISTQRSEGLRKGLYSAEMSHRTYGRLLDCAESCLQGGFTTIVDAAFLDKPDRELMRGLAQRLDVPLLIVSCTAARERLASRVQLRKLEARDASDADLHVLAAQLHDLQPLDDTEIHQSVTVDTSAQDVVEFVTAALRALASPRDP